MPPSARALFASPVGALFGVALATGIIAWLRTRAIIPNDQMLYLPVVLGFAALGGRGPAVVAAILSFVAYNFFFVEPVYTLHVADPDEVVALGVLLATALVTGQLGASLRSRAREAELREHQVSTLYELSQILGSDEPLERRLESAALRLSQLIGTAGCEILLPDASRHLHVVARHGTPASAPGADEAAEWAFVHGRPAVPGQYLVERRWVRIAGSNLRTARNVDLVCLPIQVGDRRLGVLRLVGCPASRVARELPRLQATVSLVAQAVERHDLAREATEAEILRRAEQTRSALLSSVTHDLRTPLATIKAASTNLLDEEVDWDASARRELLLAIDEETDRLTRFVNRLLELSRLEGGAAEPRMDWHSVSEILEGVVERLDPGGTRLRLDLPPEMPLAYVDYVMLEHTVANLVENALKYSPPDSPVQISAARHNSALRIAVSDRGPGVPPSERERIFEKFYRASSGAAKTPGTGIGLAIARGLAHAQQGRLWVEDNPGGGARFVVELPAKHVAESARTSDDTATDGPTRAAPPARGPAAPDAVGRVPGR